MRVLVVWGLAVALVGTAAYGSPYCVSWEGEGETAGLPEEFGWTRNWGNWDGQYQGPGAYRTLENGILTYDSLYDPGVFDYSVMHRPGQMDPDGPAETFVMEWRLDVLVVDGSYDPSVALFSDDAWGVGLLFSEDHAFSVFEGFLSIPIIPHVFHDYRLVSQDMRSYGLYIDDQLAREGVFVHLVGSSEVGWGDGVQGAASLHEWDYFRYGVIPEPSSAASVALMALGMRRFL